MPDRHELCSVEELPPSERRIVDVPGAPHSIGVFNVDGEYYALANVCPHQLAPLCEGPLTGSVESNSVGDFRHEREGEILQCPWHGWKFDVTDGSSVFNPHELRTRTYDVAVEESEENRAVSMGSEGDCAQECESEHEGAEPPIDTYSVEVEGDVVVLYI